jgi:DNA-binding NtrC family response regulator
VSNGVICLWGTQPYDVRAVLPVIKSVMGSGPRVVWQARDLDAGTSEKLPEASCHVLILPVQGVLTVGEKVHQLRTAVGRGPHLSLCTEKPDTESESVLYRCGADSVITPAGWSAREVADRILGQLFELGIGGNLSVGDLRGRTASMVALGDEVRTVAPLDDPVLILGERGSGKELVAKEIHGGHRAAQPFLAVNCAEFAPDLLPSELFGHERGAFTSADRSRSGLLIEGGAGTVFLDEIGDLSSHAQAALLRVIQFGEVRPVGGNHSIQMHARIVLATHKDLDVECAKGRFRLDLYDRIRPFTLRIPPLRERKADVPLLASHFMDEKLGTEWRSRPFRPGVLDCLFRYDWPGNVRELRGAIRVAAAYATPTGGPLNEVRLQQALHPPRVSADSATVLFDPAADTWKDVADRTRESYFRAILVAVGGNRKLAAARAGISRSRLHEILREMNGSEGDSLT